MFVLTRDGELIEDIEVGQGSIYHPGGVDFDGEHFWVPVAEYRPNSASIVYSIDPETYEVTEELRHDDRVGGVVMDATTGQVNGVSWGSPTLFAWNKQGRLLRSTTNPDGAGGVAAPVSPPGCIGDVVGTGSGARFVRCRNDAAVHPSAGSRQSQQGLSR